jgi:ribose/xylose/arabinose/galactoside ABC-type transport system permease subunit
MARVPDADAVPALLVAFFAATIGMVGAILLAVRAGSDWADAGAVVLLVAIAAALLGGIVRSLRDDGDPD